MNEKSFISSIGKIMRGLDTDAIVITSGPLLEHVVNAYKFRSYTNGRVFRIWMGDSGDMGVYVHSDIYGWTMYIIGMGESDVINFIEERETILKLEAL